MKLKKHERIICPAIWIDDKKEHDNQPENVKTGYVIYGLHMVDIFFRMRNRDKGKPINLQTLKLNEIIEGYYTNHGRFITEWIDY